MNVLHSIDSALDCAAGLLPDGWFAAVRRVRDVDEEFLGDFQRLEIIFREGATEEEWSRAFVETPRRLALVRSANGELTETLLAEAARIEGPAAASASEPVVAWTERTDGRWRLMLHAEGDTRVVVESETALSSPAAACAGATCFVACQASDRSVAVYDSAGECLFRTAGRNPRLAAADGRVFLALERSTPDTAGLCLFVLAAGVTTEIAVPSVDALNLQPSLCVDGDGTLYLAWESGPAWGFNECVGQHRDLNLWMLPPGAETLRPAPHSNGGRLYVKPEAFWDNSAQNEPPVRPVVLVHAGEPAVAFRQYRYRGMKCFGWDTSVLRHTPDGWTEPELISPASGPADARYSVLSSGDALLSFLPTCDQEPILLANLLALKTHDPRRTPTHGTQPAKRFRVEVVEGTAGAVARPGSARQAAYAIPPSVADIAPEPSEVEPYRSGRRLIWADLHAHTAYSKCMSANDGQPDEVLRFQRDVLGCRVLCLTEHVEYMTAPEFSHVLDRVEAEATGDCVPLYAVEWAKRPAHHTNIYAADRQVFDRLRALMLACNHLTPLYARIKAELPAGSVTAVRHFHGFSDGEHGVRSERVAETHDPEMERAMEAMQSRGNMMLPHPTYPLFPQPFLNAGAHLGLVGGSDHSRGGGVNRFCLTGLWVDEVTPEAVLAAIRNRQTTACSNAKIAIDATLNGASMGERVDASGEVRVRARIAAAGTTHRACLMRDGEPMDWLEIDAASAEIELADPSPKSGAHWYCVTVEADSAYADLAAIGHGSPFLVDVTA